MKKFSLTFLIAVFLISILAATAYGVISSSKTVVTSGKITTVNVGVYKDSACTQAATSIDWGNLTAGTSANYTLYVKNIGNAKETLSMTTNGWSPSAASQYITVTWNLNGVAVNANQVSKATLTLTVSPDTAGSITTFSNNIVVTGTINCCDPRTNLAGSAPDLQDSCVGTAPPGGIPARSAA